jgi:uncharacterized phiE125 gp8 family phage protein
MLLRRTSAAATSPVALAQAKAHCRLDDTAEDSLVNGYISAATDAIGEMSGRVMGEETWAASYAAISGDLVLPKSPIRAVSSITYFDTENVQRSAEITDFYLFLGEDYATLRPKPGKNWPSTSIREDAITITFTAGYTVAPPALVSAILLMIGHLYENRAATGDDVAEIPLGVDALVSFHRIGWVAA